MARRPPPKLVDWLMAALIVAVGGLVVLLLGVATMALWEPDVMVLGR